MVFQHSGAQDYDLGGGFHYSGSYPMVFQHSGAQDFDLWGGFHYSGSYPMVFQHSATVKNEAQATRTRPCLSSTPPPLCVYIDYTFTCDL